MNIKESVFDIQIMEPSGVVMEGKINALKLVNELGPFDVVARYTNFISAIKEKIIVYKLDGTTKEYPIDVGIIKVTSNRAEIFLGIDSISQIKEDG